MLEHDSTNQDLDSSIQFSRLVVSNSLWPLDHSMPGLSVHHQLQEFTQIHVHWVGDTIQPSHPLSSLSRPAFNLSQCQGLLKWVSSLHQVTKVLEFQLQHIHSGLISLRIDWLDFLAVQGTLKSLLQHQSKSVLEHAASFSALHTISEDMEPPCVFFPLERKSQP